MNFEKVFWLWGIFCLVLGLSFLGFIVWVIIKLLQHWSII